MALVVLISSRVGRGALVKLLLVALVILLVAVYRLRSFGENGQSTVDKQRVLATAGMAAKRLLSVDFEVFGLVQGVFFRKYTRNAAVDYDLVGWCMNTRQGTVKGQMQGAAENIAKMKHWLEHVGSPSSRIDRAVFQNEKEIEKLEYRSFSVEH